MPASHPYELVHAVFEAIQESGYSGGLISSMRQHPRKFVVSDADGMALSLWVYAWTLTPGGRPSLPHEYRIQMTTVSSPLDMNPDGLTVLIGYEPSLRLFAGFDLQKHRSFTAGSPSVQIDIRIVRQALQDGLAFDRKANSEIAVSIRPDQFMTYACNASGLHECGRRVAVLNLLTKASSLQEIPEKDIVSLKGERRRIIRTVSRLSRLANFRQQVLRAYGFRCAVTGMQLRLVDAAHILPVGVPGSADDVCNGIALSPTYHRAYDNGLIYLDEDHVMRINPARETDLASVKLAGGLAQIRASLGRILLPPDKRQWPHRAFVTKANRFRQIKPGGV